MEDRMTDIEHNLTFQKRPGTDNHGSEYELNLTAFYAVKLALDDHVQNARIASNVNNYGSFDDIVARVEYKDGTTKLYVIQIKHKENSRQTISFIKKLKSDFSLEKYKNSFHKDIKSGIFQTERDYLSEGVEFKNVMSCLFTNATMPKNTKHISLDKDASLSCKAQCFSSTDFVETMPDGCYTFQMYTRQPNFAKFLISRLFPVYQKGYTDVIKKLEKQFEGPSHEVSAAKRIGDCFKKELKTHIQNTDLNIHDILIDIKVSIKKSFKRVNSDFMETTLKEISDYFYIEYQSAEDIYKQHSKYSQKCDEYSEFFEKFRFYSSQHKNKDVIEAITSMIEGSLGKSQTNVAKKFIKFVRNYFEQGRLLTTQQIKMELLKIILPSTLSKEDLENRFRVFDMVTNLNDPDQKLLVSKYIKVAVQGKEEIGLLDIVDPCFCQQLDPGFLFKHMGSVIQAGKKFEFICENYIKRKFHKMCWSEEHFQNLGLQDFRSKSDAFILSISEKDIRSCSILHERKYIDLRIRKHLPKNIFESCGNHILISNESDANERAEALIKSCTTEVECFHYLKGPALEWKGSRNKMAFENRKSESSQRFCYAMKHEWEILEEDILGYFICVINIITGEPGMGKSVLLDSLITYCPSNKWVLKLNLKECENDLRKKSQEILQDPVQYIYDKSGGNCDDEFSNLLFRHMKSKNAIMVFIDNFDKISSINDDVVLRLIAKLEQLEICTWVFVLPNGKKDRLEEKFTVKAIPIEPLRINEIRYYLGKNANINELILKRFIRESRNIMGMPFNLHIVSDILRKNDLNWDNFQLTDLYEKFIYKKCEIFCEEFAGTDLVQDHQFLSLLHHYDSNFLIKNYVMTANQVQTLLKVTERYISVIGLISEVSDSVPTFCHQLLANYLTAKWLSSNIDRPVFKFMYERLFEKKFRDVRFLFDKIVTRQHPLHSAILDGNLQLVRQFCIKSTVNSCDDLSRNPLHLAMNYFSYDLENSTSYSNKLPYNIAYEIYQHSSDETFETVDCFGWFWKDYIKKSANVPDITSILKNFPEIECVKNTKLDFNNKIRYAYKCGNLEYLKLIVQQKQNIANKSKKSSAIIRSYFQPMFHDLCLSNKLLNLLVFFVLNETPFEINVLLKFKTEFGCFYDLLWFQFTEDMEKELIQSCENNLELLEEHFELTNIRERLSMEERKSIVTNMMLSGWTPLYAAIWCDHINAVRVLSNTYDVNEISGDKYLPFHCAVRRGNIDIIKSLIDAGAEVNQVNSSGDTALHVFYITYAGFRKKLDIFRLLISHSAKPTIRNSAGESCFGLAVAKEDWEIVKLFVESGFDINYKDSDMLYPALHKSSAVGQIDYVKYFLNKGANPNIQVCDKTCLDLALDKRVIDWEIVKLLIEVDANLSYIKNTKILTFLISAVEENQLMVAQYFVRKEMSTWDLFDFNFHFTWQTTKSATCDHLMELFIKNEKRLHATFLSSVIHIRFLKDCFRNDTYQIDLTAKNFERKSYFGKAVEKECWEILELFVEQGVPVDYRDHDHGYTALYKAIKSDKHEYVKYFLDKQANVNITIDGMASLDLAFSNEIVNWETVKLLVEKGADVNNCRQNEKGYTALHYAVEESHPDMVNYLINKDADLSIKDDFLELTPLELAYQLQHLNHLTPEKKICNLIILMLLTDREAKTNNGIHSSPITKFASDFMTLITEDRINLTEINYRGMSCFGWAVHNNCLEFVKQFVEHGVSVNYRDCDESSTPLHKAVEINELDYVKYFLGKGANVNIKINEKTSLDLALQNKSICWETVNMLVENGADVNCNRNKRGFTPLHYAVEGNNLEMVKYLVNKEADFLLTNDLAKQTPLEYAHDLKRINIEGFLMLRETNLRASEAS